MRSALPDDFERLEQRTLRAMRPARSSRESLCVEGIENFIGLVAASSA